MQRFDKQVALITGAASGIGRATAHRLASEGASVFCIDLQETALEETNQQLQAKGYKAATALCDVTDEAHVKDAVDKCITTFGKIDHLINMAGILRFDIFHELAKTDFEKILSVNVTGTFLMCREAIPHLLKTQGSIVNAASTAAHQGIPWGGVYCASKGALLSMTRSIAVEYAPQGIRANTVSPGDIITEGMSSPSMPEGIDYSLMQRCMSLTGRKGPEVIAGVIAMLCSEDGKHITGEDVRIDGGTRA